MALELIGAAYLVLKTERAHLHLDALNREIDVFIKEPYTITRKDDIENGRHIRRTEMKPNDPLLAMLLGEFLYCLRSGLDQMAWQLSTSLARQNKSSDICFPIYDDISTGDSRRNYLKVLKCFPAAVAKEIDALQPHNGVGAAQDHPLWQLNKLCNLDKHCVIPLHSRTMNYFVPRVPGVLVQQFESEYAVEVSVPIEYKHKLDLEPDLPCQVEFGEWNSNWRIPRHGLSDIHGFITCTVIPTFRQFRFSAMPDVNVRRGSIQSIYRKRA